MNPQNKSINLLKKAVPLLACVAILHFKVFLGKSSDKDLNKCIEKLSNQTGLHKDIIQPLNNNNESKSDNNSNNNSTKFFDELTGDLFNCAANSSLCHCVSVDLAMGKGIAKLFKS